MREHMVWEVSEALEQRLALLLALMTEHAETRCPEQLERIRGQLFCLAGRPELPWPLRVLLAQLRRRWSVLAAEDDAGRLLH